MKILTATGKEQALVDFYRQLSRDGTNVTDLAKRARVGRAALTELFNGRRNGKHTWRHVLPLLSKEAVSLLKQCSAWNRYAEDEQWLIDNLPHRNRRGVKYKTDFGTLMVVRSKYLPGKIS